MNTEQAKNFLQKTINAMPNDFALREVRYYLMQAAKKLESVENKRTKREIQQKQLNLQNPLTIDTTLNVIDEMLAEEKKKLKNITEKKNKPKDETLFG